MECPACKTDMVPGQVSLRGTALGLAVVGLSHQHLFFERYEKEAGEEVIVASDGRRFAFFCEACTCTVILQDKQTWMKWLPEDFDGLGPVEV